MLRYFLRTLGAHFHAGRTLFALTVVGVALGVASVLSIQIINRNALGAFEGSVRAVGGESDFSVLPRTPTLDETLYPRVLAEPGVAAAWPVYVVDVALAGETDEFIEVVGVDPFAGLALPWVEGAGAEAAAPLDTPGWVAISPRLAAERGLAPGSRFDVTSGSREVTLTVGALVDFTKLTPLAGSRLAVMDIAQAQSLLGRPGGLHRIEVEAREGEALPALRARIEQALGPAAVTRTLDERRGEAEGLLAAFRLNLTALSLISLFVGGFLVTTSTRASLVRRREEFGVLRALGTRRGEVLGLIAGEVALLGLLGVALGIPLGYGAAAFSVERVSATLSNLYLLQEIERLELPWHLWALAASIGLGGTLAGAAGPALEVTRADPRQLLAAWTLREGMRSGARRLMLVGLAIVALTALVWFVGLRDQRYGGFVLGSGLLVGLPLAAPWVVRGVTRRLPLVGFGPAYGAKALGLRIETTAFAVAALGVAVTMLVGITIMIGSFRRTVEVWLGGTLRADVYVTTESWRRARDAAALDPDVLRELMAIEGVSRVDRLRQFFVFAGEREIALAGVDFSLPVETGRFELIGGDPEQARRAVLEDGAVLISEPLARKDGLRPGDDLLLAGPDGTLSFPVAGVFYDYSSERGGAAMDMATMERAFGPGPISNVALYLDPARDAERVVGSLKQRFAGTPVVVRSNRDIREEVFRIFDQTFAVTRLLQAMSLVIAVAGITLTLIVLARERVSELALYRALGARRRQIFGVFVGKGLGIAVLGVVLGSVGGVALAFILIFIINRAWFGWTIALHWPWGALLQGLALLLAAATLASVYPALRASRTPATELSRENL